MFVYETILMGEATALAILCLMTCWLFAAPFLQDKKFSGIFLYAHRFVGALILLLIGLTFTSVRTNWVISSHLDDAVFHRTFAYTAELYNELQAIIYLILILGVVTLYSITAQVKNGKNTWLWHTILVGVLSVSITVIQVLF